MKLESTIFKRDFLVGADPEIFLQDKETKTFKSAHDIIPGTKYQPFPLSNKAETAILADGVALEFNLKPCKTQEEFNQAIDLSLEDIKKGIPKEIEFNTLESGKFIDIKIFNELPEEATQLGCEPDFSAWNNGRANKPDTNIFQDPFRCVAGHIHIGCFTEKTKEELQKSENHLDNLIPYTRQSILTLVKNLDFYLGIPFYMLDKSKGKEDRTKLYGNWGAFRVKPYGIEYRTPSNFWLWDKEAKNSIFKRIEQAILYTMYLDLPSRPKVDQKYNKLGATSDLIYDYGRNLVGTSKKTLKNNMKTMIEFEKAKQEFNDEILKYL